MRRFLTGTLLAATIVLSGGVVAASDFPTIPPSPGTVVPRAELDFVRGGTTVRFHNPAPVATRASTIVVTENPLYNGATFSAVEGVVCGPNWVVGGNRFKKVTTLKGFKCTVQSLAPGDERTVAITLA